MQLLIIQSAINAVAATAIYFFVVKKRGTTIAYLIGYGVICPILVLAPFELARYLTLSNMSMFVGLTAPASILFFRCMMAIHGTNEQFVERDLQNYVLFYLAPLQFNFDPKTGEVMSSSSKLLRIKGTKLLHLMLILPIVLGILQQYDYEIFPRQEIKTFVDFFYWANILNNYAMAYLTGICLQAGTLGVGFLIELLSGKSVIELSDAPLTASSSPSDFWSQRWNRLVHLVLKRAVYMPLQNNGISKQLSALATFGASGLLHEYVLTALAFKHVLLKDHTAYVPRYGMHLYFFLWNGIVLILESIFYKHPIFQWMKTTLPRPLLTMTVLMTVLPIGHWFTGT